MPSYNYLNDNLLNLKLAAHLSLHTVNHYFIVTTICDLMIFFFDGDNCMF